MEEKSLYESANQVRPFAPCGSTAIYGTRAKFSSHRFQRGFFTFANSSGALSIAKGAKVELFNAGVNGEAQGAGFPGSVKFTDADTNVLDATGLADCEVLSASVFFGRPVVLSASGEVLTVSESDTLEAYQDGLILALSENVSIAAVVDPNDTAPVFSLGSPVMLSSHHGHSAPFPGSHATPGLPVLLRERIDIPPQSGTRKPFLVRATVERALAFAARSTPAVGAVSVPITVALEIQPRGMN